MIVEIGREVKKSVSGYRDQRFNPWLYVSLSKILSALLQSTQLINVK